MRDRMVSGGLIALALVALIGCNSSAASSSAPASTAPESAAPSVEAPSAVAPSEAAASQAAPSEAAASLPTSSFKLPSDAKELEALIPEEFCGSKVTKLSMKGSDALGTSDDPTMGNVLKELGKSPSDVSAALGIAGTTQCGTFIFRIQGADEGKLREIFKRLADEGKITYTEVSLGGKTVARIQGEDLTVPFDYVWVKGDGLISVVADTEAHAGEIISQMP